MAKLTAGQTLYRPPSRRNPGAIEYTVTGVARKWAALAGGYRVNMETLGMDIDGFSSIQLYFSEKDYQDKLATKAAMVLLGAEIGRLGQQIFYSAPAPCVTLETIKQVRALLGLDGSK